MSPLPSVFSLLPSSAANDANRHQTRQQTCVELVEPAWIMDFRAPFREHAVELSCRAESFDAAGGFDNCVIRSTTACRDDVPSARTSSGNGFRRPSRLARAIVG